MPRVVSKKDKVQRHDPLHLQIQNDEHVGVKKASLGKIQKVRKDEEAVDARDGEEVCICILFLYFKFHALVQFILYYN